MVPPPFLRQALVMSRFRVHGKNRFSLQSDSMWRIELGGLDFIPCMALPMW